MKCVFCEIAAGNSHAEILYQDEFTLAFLDINPMNFGHTLVIPKLHYEDIFDLPADLVPQLFSVVKKVSTAVSVALQPDGLNLVMNNRRAAGQSVFHSHVHLIPRYNSDGFKFRLNLKKYKNGEMNEFGKKIRVQLKEI